MKKDKLFSIISIVIMVILAGLYLTVATPCIHDGEGPAMKCIWTHRVVIGLAIMLIITGIIKLFQRPSVALGINLVEILIAVFGVLVMTFIIGTCGDPAMPCNALMRSSGLIAWIAYIIVDGIALFRYKSLSQLPGESHLD